MKTTTGDIVGELENAINDIMLRLEEQEGILTGDCPPWEAKHIGDLVEELADVLMGVLELNKYDPIRLKNGKE